MKLDLQNELTPKTAWNRSDVERLALVRPRVTMWRFAPESTFNSGALSLLEGAPKLRVLTFRDSTLTRHNLLSLAHLPDAVRLDLHGCRFDSGDFRELCDALQSGGSPKMRELWLEDTLIGDEELEALGKIERLRWLMLSGTKISNAGFAHLQGLKRLETLWLDRTEISDEGVLQLATLPKLSGMPTRETGCSPDVREKLFEARLALGKPKKAPNAEQVALADKVLRAFLEEMEAWERSAFERAQEIEARFRAARPMPHQMSAEESRETEGFWRAIADEKALIARRFCSAQLLGRGAGSAGSYGDPPQFEAQNSVWLNVETPSKVTTRFVGPGQQADDKRRYILKLEGDKWKLDEVQTWSGGWKRELV